VHIGPHATLYTDQLLSDMGLQSGHVRDGIWEPFRAMKEWFRPMYPAIYQRVVAERKERACQGFSEQNGRVKNL
jgi:hypothetical protein